MPYTTEFSTDGVGLLQRGSGTLTADELIAVTISVSQAGDRLSAVRYAVVDLSEVTQFVGTAQDLATLADHDVALSRLVPDVAIVVIARLPVMFGMARMWEALSHRTGWRYMVVQTREEAVEWLRREVPDVVIA